jgi:DNA repair photolyase
MRNLEHPMVEYPPNHMPRALYRPEGRAREFSEWAANPYDGCGLGCFYCYVADFIGMALAEFNAGAIEKPNFLEALRRDAARLQAEGLAVQAMISFTSDPYHAGDTSLTRDTYIVLAEHGHGFSPLSKGGSRGLRDIDLFRPKHDAYAVTLTSASDSYSAKYERKAASVSERIATLRAFFEHGIWTWVSGEPVLSISQTLAMIACTYEFTNHYKLGGLNHFSLREPVDLREFTLRACDLLSKLGRSAYFKKDCWPYLPAGWNNDMRVQQHY